VSCITLFILILQLSSSSRGSFFLLSFE
jgi:hypothetical protein